MLKKFVMIVVKSKIIFRQLVTRQWWIQGGGGVIAPTHLSVCFTLFSYYNIGLKADIFIFMILVCLDVKVK